MPTVDVSIVTWNSATQIEHLLRSLQAQTVKLGTMYVVDNASTDETQKIVANFPQVQWLPQSSNIGFAAGHNLAIRQSTADYILVCNPDVVLEPTYLEKLVDAAEEHLTVASFVGIVRGEQAGTIDTTGLRISRYRVVRERKDIPTTPKKIFGISGAVALYRRRALEECKVEDEYFNELYFAYKEDVELAWRLQWAGWEAMVVPEALATHSRVVRMQTQRIARSEQRRLLSTRNHYLLYATAETWGTLGSDLWLILPAELFRLFYLLVTDFRVTSKALAQVLKMWHAARTFAVDERRFVHARQLRTALRL